MNVAIICPDDLSVVLFCERITKECLRNPANRVYVFSDLFDERRDDYVSQIRFWGAIPVRIRFARFIHLGRDLKYIWDVYRALRNYRIDFVVNISTKPNIYGSLAAKAAGARCMCSVWGLGLGFLNTGTMRNRVLQWVVRQLYGIAFRCADRVWFTNQHDADYFLTRGLVARSKLIVTNNYVNAEQYASSAVTSLEISAVRDELALSTTDRVVLMVARMTWAKGVREFAEAAALLKDRFGDVKFVLVGPLEHGSPDAVPEAALHDYERQANLTWLGFRSDTKRLYAIADLAVLPSYYPEGGFPRALTEPMSMGKAVIAADTVHCRGPIDVGKNGVLVPIKNSRALADAIAALIEDPKRLARFGEHSRQKVLREFDENVIVESVMAAVLGTIPWPGLKGSA